MELIYKLLTKYYDEEKTNIIMIILISIMSNAIQTNGVSHFNAEIITFLQKRDFSNTLYFFKWFMAIWVLYILTKRVYKYFQNKLLTKLRQWIRFKLTEMLMISNNESLSNMNFTKLSAPISRTGTTCFKIVSDIITYIVPSVVFILVNVFFLFYYDMKLGSMFVIGNLCWMFAIYLYWEELRTMSRDYEASSLETDTYLIEILNNMDKVIVRGQYNHENNQFDNLKDKTIKKAYKYYSSVANVVLITDIIIISTIFACIGYSMYKVKTKQMSSVLFVTIFSVFIIFRERVTGIAVQLADMIELYGRSEAVLPSFKDFSHIIEEDKVDKPITYSDITTPFNQISFNNITFKYPDTEDYVIQNKSLVLNTNNNNIIGVTGPSGNGKSTIMKIALKLYPLTAGEIKIDDVDIQSLDPHYIRKNITYINQNSRLFDKTIVDNIMYGCKDNDVCKEHFDNIMKYPRIVELFKELDVANDAVGYSGEKISGGQRQIVNLISGLVNPSKILVLDEPTNALDSELKKEVIEIIKYFKQHKQCIIIITHDKDVHSTFDEQIQI